MRVRLKRLARRDRAGDWDIERATLLAGGIAFDGAVAWIEAHGGAPEMAGSTSNAARGCTAPAPQRPARRCASCFRPALWTSRACGDRFRIQRPGR